MKVVINTKQTFSMSYRQIYEYLYRCGCSEIVFEIISLIDDKVNHITFDRMLDEFKKSDYMFYCNDYEFSNVLYIDTNNKKCKLDFIDDIKRYDTNLIAAIELYPNDIIGTKIVEIPDNINWYIHINEFGCEVIHETHRMWS